MITYQFEALKDIIDEVIPMVRAHWEETGKYKDRVPFDPDYNRYYQLESLGILQIITVRDGWKLIGYSFDLVMNHAHHKENIFADNDLLYVAPEYRKQNIADQLLDFVEAQLRNLGVTVHLLHMKEGHTYEPLALKHGYDKFEYVHSKYIGE